MTHLICGSKWWPKLQRGENGSHSLTGKVSIILEENQNTAEETGMNYCREYAAIMRNDKGTKADLEEHKEGLELYR